MVVIRQARFLVLRGGAIGDFILTLPVLQALREQWPDSYIEIVGYPHIATLALAARLADRVESLDRAGMARFFTPTPTFTEEQAAHVRSFDVVFTYLHDPTEAVRDNLRSAGAQMVVYGSPIVTEGHAVDHLLKPLESLAIYAKGATPCLRLHPEHLQRGREWLTNHGLTATPVALHPGSGSPQKNWAAESFLEIARSLAARGQSPFFILGEADTVAGAIIAEQLPEISVLKDATLLEVAAVLANCAAYLGHDSGITHIAAAVGIPVVALFGPTDPERWGPRGARVQIIRAPDGDLAKLSVAMVQEALARVLGKRI